jgi:hypothetical protein
MSSTTSIKLLLNVTLNRVISSASSSEYFPPHETKLRYLALSEQYSPEDPQGHKLLSTALLKRAMTDVSRVLQLREEKGPLQQLVAKGSVNQEIFDNLLKAEAELEYEINLVIFTFSKPCTLAFRRSRIIQSRMVEYHFKRSYEFS